MEILSRLGYGGIFVPKPDSPCNYMENNCGPDGCAIFWKLNRLDLIKYSKRILRVYKYQTNQVVLCATFRHRESDRELCVATTHLKARRGPILSAFRYEQGMFIVTICLNVYLFLYKILII
jgi:nocturnin